MTVPIVDMSADDDVCADALARGLSAIGFVQLINHRADAGAAADLRTACDEFFALDANEKASTICDDPLANRGWRSKGSESLSYSLGAASPPDLFESFNCGDDARVHGNGLFQQTPWPAQVPGLRGAAHGWLAQMARLSARLDTLIGAKIGFDLSACSTSGPDTMACIDYRPGPNGEESVATGQQRMGAHSDYTSFTLLLADPVPGLQIVGADGEWVDVCPDEGSLLMNVGDLLAMFTNDVWPSTLHRVVPMAAGAAPTRRSVAYFHYPNAGVSIAPLPGFVSDHRPARYVDVTVEGHLRSKLASPKDQVASTGAMTIAERSHAIDSSS